MKALWGFVLLPTLVNAQPPSPYVCTHVDSNPYTGQDSCEAVADSVAYPSYLYYFPQTAAGDPPSGALVAAAPEISVSGAVTSVTLLLGLLACFRGRLYRER